MLIDLSGYSFTGKSAYHDFLCNAKNIASLGVEAEFDLVRAPGGLLDLHNACCAVWSPIRSSEAIRRFNRLIQYLGGKRNLYDRLTRFGPHYDQLIHGFTYQSHSFLSKLVNSSWNGSWPFAAYDETHIISIVKKYLGKIGFFQETKIYLSSMDSEEFKSLCINYITSLFPGAYTAGNSALVLNNCFEPFDPSNAMKFFPDSRSIIVDRDPRDIYISASNNRVINGIDVGGAVVGGSVDSFIDRFLTYRNRVSNTPSEKILRTNFENLILDCNSEISKLSNVLKPLKIEWDQLMANFDLARSRKNIRQWLLPENKKYIDDVQKIKIRLPDYCIL